MYKKGVIRTFLLLLLTFGFIGSISLNVAHASPKSMYVIADLSNPTPLQAWDIQAPPSYLVYQTSHSLPSLGAGAVGIALDEDSSTLFITYESSASIRLVDATTMTSIGTITAPGGSNLAGIVYDRTTSKLYTVQRSSNLLYRYSWNSVTNTLTLDGGTSIALSGVTAAHGLAIDEVNGLLYVGDMVSTNNVRVFSTSTWAQTAVYSVTQPVQGIAVDFANGIIYTGHAGWPAYGTMNLLCKYVISTSTETTVDIRTLTTSTYDDSVVGLAVDPDSSYLYITTGNQGSEGRAYDDTDQIMVLNSNLNVLWDSSGDIGDPTGIVIPREEVSYNPLNLVKDDGLPGNAIPVGGTITYTISYSNTNPYDVHNVEISDTLPNMANFISSTGGGIHSVPTNTVWWQLFTVPSGASGSVTVTVQVMGLPPSTMLDNAVEIDSDETPPTTTHEFTWVVPGQVIPEIPFGTISALTTLLASYGLFNLRKKQ